MFRTTNNLMVGVGVGVLFVVSAVALVVWLLCPQILCGGRINSQIYITNESSSESECVVDSLENMVDENDIRVNISDHIGASSSSSSQVVMLLGDSIIDNGVYVPKGKSVSDWLQKKMGDSGFKIKLFAKDGYTTEDVYLQISSLPIQYNSANTTIVLSVGGNDFLSGAPYERVETIYRYLIERIRGTFGSCKLYVVNLYKPVDRALRIYDRIITKWNLFLNELVATNEVDGVVDIYGLIKEPRDLVHKIEPSAIGGEKIAEAILVSVSSVGY